MIITELKYLNQLDLNNFQKPRYFNQLTNIQTARQKKKEEKSKVTYKLHN